LLFLPFMLDLLLILTLALGLLLFRIFVLDLLFLFFVLGFVVPYHSIMYIQGFI
jgi:hypothetical protein